MLNVNFRNFNGVNYSCKPYQSEQRNITNPQLQSIDRDTISFGAAKLETVQELLQKESFLKAYFAKVTAIQKHISRLVTGHEEGVGSPHVWSDRLPANGSMCLRAYSDGTPHSLCTPFGKICLAGQNSADRPKWEEIMPRLQEELGLVEILPGIQGKKGPIYAITRDLEGNPLPQATGEELVQNLGNYPEPDFNNLGELIKRAYLSPM